MQELFGAAAEEQKSEMSGVIASKQDLIDLSIDVIKTMPSFRNFTNNLYSEFI